MRLLAIDPGPIESALVIYDPVARAVEDAQHITNGKALHDVRHLHSLCHSLIVETPCYYGERVGASTLDTAFWAGGFYTAWQGEHAATLVRPVVVRHLCGFAAKKSQVNAALIARFGADRRSAFGTKKHPGPLFKLRGTGDHGLAALAVALVWWEQSVPQGRDCAERNAGGTT